MSREIYGATVGTPMNPQAVVERTEQAKQIEKNKQAITELSQTVAKDYAKKTDVTDELTSKADLVDGKVPESQLPELGVNEQQLNDAVESALQQAKESGDFKGDPFTYEDFTSDQLARLKGEKGDAFTYEDFTPEQLEALKGKPGADSGGKSIKGYYEDGDKDDTKAFQRALAANRMVYVPEGEYTISEPLVIRENCEFELAQSAVLNFTQITDNCITLLRCASLKGNHATIYVPYAFSGNVINASTEADYNAVADKNGDGDKTTEYNEAVEPFEMWDPQWKMSRYVTDVNICKKLEDGEHAGCHYSKTGDTAGKAVSMVCTIEDGGQNYMWGVNMSGLRIAGAFDYGVYIYNEVIGKNKRWNHDMRVEAVIDACKTGVYVENCNSAHLALSVQPRAADNGAVYGEHGIHLKNSKWVDLSSCFVWDKQNIKTGFYKFAFEGECPGTVLSVPNYYEDKTVIYSDNQSNLETMTLLQKGGNSDNFTSKSGKPYYSSEETGDKELLLKETFDSCFDVDIIKGFTDLLAVAKDTDGNVLNGKGYRTGARLHENGTVTESAYYGYTGFIPCKKGDVIYAENLTYAVGDDYCKAVFYDADKNYVSHINRGNIIGGSQYYAKYAQTDNGFTYEIVFPEPKYDNIAFVRFTFSITAFGANPMISVNEDISYESSGFLADGVKVKAKNVIGLDNETGGTPIQGEKGDKGDPFTYEDFTEEQLAALKGDDGYTPVKGVDYFDGQDGVSCTHSWNGTTLNVTSASGTSSADLKGDKGDAFTYADFKPEQLEALKGEKGDPFTYEDFTPEQLATLKGEPGARGKSAFEYARDAFYLGTEEEFSARLAKDPTVFVVKVTGDDENRYTSSATYDKIREEVDKGRNVVCLLDEGDGRNINHIYLHMISRYASDGSSNVKNFYFSYQYGVDIIDIIIYENATVEVNRYYAEMKIGDESWDGIDPVDFTDTINGMIDAKVENLGGDTEGNDNIFLITVTGDETDGYSMDRTKGELDTARGAQKQIYCRFGLKVFGLTSYNTQRRIYTFYHFAGSQYELITIRTPSETSTSITYSSYTFPTKEDVLSELPKGTFEFAIIPNGDGTFSSTKTYDEVHTAYMEGSTLLCMSYFPATNVAESVYLPLMEHTGSTFKFGAHYGGCFIFASIGSGDELYWEITETSISIGDNVWNGSSSVDFTDTINSMIDRKVQNAGGGTGGSDNGVVWITSDVSIVTLQASNFSHTYDEILELIALNKPMKYKGTFERGIIFGDVAYYNFSMNLIVIQAIVQTNFGNGTMLYYFNIEIEQDNTAVIKPYIVNTTSLGG